MSSEVVVVVVVVAVAVAVAIVIVSNACSLYEFTREFLYPKWLMAIWEVLR